MIHISILCLTLKYGKLINLVNHCGILHYNMNFPGHISLCFLKT